MKFMTRTCIRSFYLPVVLCLLQTALFAQVKTLQTDYAMIGIDSKGFITSIKENKTGKEYCPKGISSALMSLYKNNQYILPIKATFNGAKHEIVLTYSNGSVARIKVESKKQYLRFQLLSLKPGNGEECIVWGPYKTTIQEIIGETIGVVRNKEFAIGVQALDINSIEGVPENGDDAGGGYFIDPLPAKRYRIL